MRDSQTDRQTDTQPHSHTVTRTDLVQRDCDGGFRWVDQCQPVLEGSLIDPFAPGPLEIVHSEGLLCGLAEGDLPLGVPVNDLVNTSCQLSN